MDTQADNNLEEFKTQLVAEFKRGAEQGFRYLTLSRLCWSIGLDPSQENNRALTTKLLRRLPKPPGPSHADTKHYDPPKAPDQQLWRNPFLLPEA